MALASTAAVSLVAALSVGSFMELFLELTLLRRMDVLAEKLVPWEPMNHEHGLALLAKRTKPMRASSA
jgi:hypothetical protein